MKDALKMKTLCKNGNSTKHEEFYNFKQTKERNNIIPVFKMKTTDNKVFLILINYAQIIQKKEFIFKTWAETQKKITHNSNIYKFIFKINERSNEQYVKTKIK